MATAMKSGYRRDTGVDLQKLLWVIAFDPGETTGWTVMGISSDDLRWEGPTKDRLQDAIKYIDYGQIDCVTGVTDGFSDQVNKHAGIAFTPEAIGVAKMLSIILRYPNPAIVVEDFVIDFSRIDKARHTLSPVRIMSMLSYALIIEAETHLNSKLFVQDRSMPKTTCTDLRLKNWGLYDTHSGRHARDATRHAFYFLRSVRGPETKHAEKRWRAWPETFKDPFASDETTNAKGVVGTKPASKRPRKAQKGERVRFA